MFGGHDPFDGFSVAASAGAGGFSSTRSALATTNNWDVKTTRIKKPDGTVIIETSRCDPQTGQVTTSRRVEGGNGSSGEGGNAQVPSASRDYRRDEDPFSRMESTRGTHKNGNIDSRLRPPPAKTTTTYKNTEDVEPAGRNLLELGGPSGVSGGVSGRLSLPGQQIARSSWTGISSGKDANPAPRASARGGAFIGWKSN
ncbi:unnamed protein product [Amoebophrya sp. A25]|nr:unnamed protein product [Amoebophrya sp. A25]|eukprot:GSA25T00006464001.1